MSRIAYRFKNKASVIVFFLIFALSVFSNLCSIHKEYLFFGSGYFTSSTFLLSLLVTLVLTWITLKILILISRTEVLILEERGISDLHNAFVKTFIPFENIISIELYHKKHYFLELKVKQSKPRKFIQQLIDNLDARREFIITIPLKNINVNYEELKGYIDFVRKK